MTFALYPSLADRVVLVTGGASGIGADIVRAFAANQARVAFLDIQQAAGEELAAALAGARHQPLFLNCDLTDIDALKAAIANVRERLGPVGVLVNNAANDDRHAIDEVTVDYWDWSQAINLRPQFFAAQAVRPHMRELGGGAIINLSSVLWRVGSELLVGYSAAKGGVISLTRSLGRAFGDDNIRVNAIEPGAVMTERQRELWYKTEESVAAMVARQSLKRVLLGEEIARTALFLAADDSRMITRQSITVDAGLS
jgi:NAD(P)-dependent dehydrogenase (short-subunit alcohol dehydrogenase family)